MHNNKTFLNSLSLSLVDSSPCIEFETIDFARDFELPGFPTRKRGIRSSMHITIINTFSLRAALRAMF